MSIAFRLHLNPGAGQLTPDAVAVDAGIDSLGCIAAAAFFGWAAGRLASDLHSPHFMDDTSAPSLVIAGSSRELTASAAAARKRAEELLRSTEVASGTVSADDAVELTRALLQLVRRVEQPREVRRRQELAERTRDHRAQVLSTLLTDRVMRSECAANATHQARNLLTQTGVPDSLPTVDQLQLKALHNLGAMAPAIAGIALRRRIEQHAKPFILPAEEGKLGPSLAGLRKEGFRINVNQLGEAVLGHAEAERNLEAYEQLLQREDIGVVSVKISSICAQLTPVGFDDGCRRAQRAIERLYRAAMQRADKHRTKEHRADQQGAPVRRAAGQRSGASDRVVMLDMEAYADLLLTYEAFEAVLSKPEFHSLQAGIVLQAYVPDSHTVLERLLEFAAKRHRAGGAPLQLRIVKGANLAAERTLASERGWALPTFGSKQEADASFKRMLDRTLASAHLGHLQVGIGSHNVFEVAHALLALASRRRPRGVHFEVLCGMGDALARALRLLGQEVLVYAPAVEREHLHSAIAYLVRRLDENTGQEHFMRQGFALTEGDEDFQRHERCYRQSLQGMQQLDLSPRRRERKAPVGGAAIDGSATDGAAIDGTPSEPLPQPAALAQGFSNVPDTDFCMPRERQRVQQCLRKLRGVESLPLSSLAPGIDFSGKTVTGADPSRPGFTPYRYSLATEAEALEMVARAHGAKAHFRAVPVRERARLLARVAEVLSQHRGELIAAMVLDGAKTVAEADTEVSEAVDFANYYAHSALELWESGEARPEPRGICLVAAPWNFPLAIPLGGVFAALAAGNVALLKPAPETPFVAASAYRLCVEAGVPREALQLLITSDDVAASVVQDRRVDMVVLTGASSTARRLRELRPDLHLLAETGGKNATIVTNHADLDLAAQDAANGAFGHAGQKCSATSLLIITPQLAKSRAFRSQLCDAASSLHVGSAWDMHTRIPPLIRPPEGPLLQALTQRESHEQWWLEPSVDANNPALWSPGIKMGVLPGSSAHLTEFFGPVLSVLVARDLPQAVQWANAVEYGLTAGLQSLNEAEQQYFSKHMQAGNLYFNRPTTGAIVRRQPFGGMKASCFGPGAKAGGPFYLSQFVHLRPATRARSLPEAKPSAHPRATASAKPHVPARAGDGPQRKKGWLGLGCSLLQQHCEELVSLAEHCVRTREHLLRDTDPSQVLGQRNLFRLKPRQHGVVAVCAGATELEVVRVLIALESLGLTWPLLDRRSGWCGSDPWSRLTLRGEAQRALLSKPFVRIRALGTPDPELVHAMTQNDGYLDASPFLGGTSLELHKYMLEQSLSSVDHRHGYLGMQPPVPV